MTTSKIVQQFDWSFWFFSCQIFGGTLKKKVHPFFQKWTKKIRPQKNKQKKSSESLENCTTFDAGNLNVHFSLLFKKIWNTLLHVRHKVWHQFGSVLVRRIHWHPLGLNLTHGCPLTPLNLLKMPAEIPWF